MPAERKKLSSNPVLLTWRRMISKAVDDAKRTAHGLATDGAILARWWLEEHKPHQSDKEEWERSFECCCVWLQLNVDEERARLLADIDAHHQREYASYVRKFMYVRRAAVLSCAGIPTTIARQYQLPLVSMLDFEEVAGVEHPDPPARGKREHKKKLARVLVSAAQLMEMPSASAAVI